MSVEHWAEYYKGGWLVSAPLGSRSNYQGELLQSWQTFFASLRPGSRLIDIGTGNGPIALIARDVAVNRRIGLDVHGVDLAAIDPPASVAGGTQLFEGIRFHPGVAAESLPFEDRSVQAVCGQFALEYTDVDATLTELARVLEPGGVAMFILHHADSTLAAHATESLRHGELILRETRVFERLRRFLEAERLEPGRAPALHRQLTETGRVLTRAATTTQHPELLQGVQRALATIFAARGRTSTAELLRSIDGTERSLRTMLPLLDELLVVARTPAQMDALASAADRDFDAEYGPQYHGTERLYGWTLRLTRRSDTPDRS
jgi:SAM-dependent methyltransferase